MKSDEPKAKLIELLKHAEDGCYASDVVRNKTPIRAHLIVNDDELYVISLPYENFKNSKYQWLFNLSEKEFNESDIFIKHYL